MLRGGLTCTFLIMVCLSARSGFSQDLNPRDFYFEWRPNGTAFLLANHSRYLSDPEYEEILDCLALAFDVQVNLATNAVVAVQYSTLSTLYNTSAGTRDMKPELARKLEIILFENIGLTKVKRINGEKVEGGTVWFLLTLDFSVADKRRKNRGDR